MFRLNDYARRYPQRFSRRAGLRDAARLLARCLLPWTCIRCRGPADWRDLCEACAAELPPNLPACLRCALPSDLPDTAQGCGVCAGVELPWQRAIAWLQYAHPASAVLHALKYGRRIAVARVCGEALGRHVALSLGEADLPAALVPVPLHPKRLRERGFNQAAEIARALGRELGLPCVEHGVKRVIHTPSLTLAASRDARRAQIANAFRATCAPPAHVAIIDDVMTTGATAGALSAVLAAAGCRRIEVLTVARSANGTGLPGLAPSDPGPAMPDPDGR